MGGSASKGQQIKAEYDPFELKPEKAALETFKFRGKKQRRPSFVKNTLERVVPNESAERAGWRAERIGTLTSDMEVRVVERKAARAAEAREIRDWRKRANAKYKKRRAQMLADAGMSPDGEAVSGPPQEKVEAFGAIVTEAARWWNVLDEWAVVRRAALRQGQRKQATLRIAAAEAATPPTKVSAMDAAGAAGAVVPAQEAAEGAGTPEAAGGTNSQASPSLETLLVDKEDVRRVLTMCQEPWSIWLADQEDPDDADFGGRGDQPEDEQVLTLTQGGEQDDEMFLDESDLEAKEQEEQAEAVQAVVVLAARAAARGWSCEADAWWDAWQEQDMAAQEATREDEPVLAAQDVLESDEKEQTSMRAAPFMRALRRLRQLASERLELQLAEIANVDLKKHACDAPWWRWVHESLAAYNKAVAERNKPLSDDEEEEARLAKQEGEEVLVPSNVQGIPGDLGLPLPQLLSLWPPKDTRPAEEKIRQRRLEVLAKARGDTSPTAAAGAAAAAAAAAAGDIVAAGGQRIWRRHLRRALGPRWSRDAEHWWAAHAEGVGFAPAPALPVDVGESEMHRELLVASADAQLCDDAAGPGSAGKGSADSMPEEYTEEGKEASEDNMLGEEDVDAGAPGEASLAADVNINPMTDETAPHELDLWMSATKLRIAMSLLALEQRAADATHFPVKAYRKRFPWWQGVAGKMARAAAAAKAKHGSSTSVGDTGAKIHRVAKLQLAEAVGTSWFEETSDMWEAWACEAAAQGMVMLKNAQEQVEKAKQSDDATMKAIAKAALGRAKQELRAEKMAKAQRGNRDLRTMSARRLDLLLAWDNETPWWRHIHARMVYPELPEGSSSGSESDDEEAHGEIAHDKQEPGAMVVSGAKDEALVPETAEAGEDGAEGVALLPAAEMEGSGGAAEAKTRGDGGESHGSISSDSENDDEGPAREAEKKEEAVHQALVAAKAGDTTAIMLLQVASEEAAAVGVAGKRSTTDDSWTSVWADDSPLLQRVTYWAARGGRAPRTEGATSDAAERDVHGASVWHLAERQKAAVREQRIARTHAVQQYYVLYGHFGTAGVPRTAVFHCMHGRPDKYRAISAGGGAGSLGNGDAVGGSESRDGADAAGEYEQADALIASRACSWRRQHTKLVYEWILDVLSAHDEGLLEWDVASAHVEKAEAAAVATASSSLATAKRGAKIVGEANNAVDEAKKQRDVATARCARLRVALRALLGSGFGEVSLFSDDDNSRTLARVAAGLEDEEDDGSGSESDGSESAESGTPDAQPRQGVPTGPSMWYKLRRECTKRMRAICDPLPSFFKSKRLAAGLGNLCDNPSGLPQGSAKAKAQPPPWPLPPWGSGFKSSTMEYHASVLVPPVPELLRVSGTCEPSYRYHELLALAAGAIDPIFQQYVAALCMRVGKSTSEGRPERPDGGRAAGQASRSAPGPTVQAWSVERQPLTARCMYLREGGGGPVMAIGGQAPATCCPDVISCDVGVVGVPAAKELVRLLCTTGLPKPKIFVRAGDGQAGVVEAVGEGGEAGEAGANTPPLPPPLVFTGAQNGYEADFDVDDTHGDRAITLHCIFDAGAAMSFLADNGKDGDCTWEKIGGTRAARAAWRLRAQDQEKFGTKRADAIAEMVGWLTGGVRRGASADDGNGRLLGLGGHRAKLRVEINIRQQRFHQA